MLSCHRFLGDTGPWSSPIGLCDFLLRQCWTDTDEYFRPLQTSPGPSPWGPYCQVPLRRQALPRVGKLAPWRRDIATWSRCEL